MNSPIDQISSFSSYMLTSPAEMYSVNYITENKKNQEKFLITFNRITDTRPSVWVLKFGTIENLEQDKLSPIYLHREHLNISQNEFHYFFIEIEKITEHFIKLKKNKLSTIILSIPASINFNQEKFIDGTFLKGLSSHFGKRFLGTHLFDQAIRLIIFSNSKDIKNEFPSLELENDEELIKVIAHEFKERKKFHFYRTLENIDITDIEDDIQPNHIPFQKKEEQQKQEPDVSTLPINPLDDVGLSEKEIKLNSIIEKLILPKLDLINRKTIKENDIENLKQKSVNIIDSYVGNGRISINDYQYVEDKIFNLIDSLQIEKEEEIIIPQTKKDIKVQFQESSKLEIINQFDENEILSKDTLQSFIDYSGTNQITENFRKYKKYIDLFLQGSKKIPKEAIEFFNSNSPQQLSIPEEIIRLKTFKNVNDKEIDKLNKALKKLSHFVLGSFNLYTEDSTNFNNFLRFPEKYKIIKNESSIINMLITFKLNKIKIKSNSIVYRSTSTDTWLEDKIPGDLVFDEGFFSTSSSEKFAKNRILSKGVAGNLYEIYLPRYSSCISLNTTSVFPSEKEILLPPASLFLITEMKHRSSLQKNDANYDLKFNYGYIYKLLYIGSAVDYIFKTRFPQQYEKE